jgi:hypothetical protein
LAGNSDIIALSSIRGSILKVLCIESTFPVPTYWVSCDVQEAKDMLEIFELEENDRRAYESRINDLENNVEIDPVLIFREKYLDPFQDRIGFLVSEDLGPIRFYPPHYPVASLWNGYNPFRFFEPIEIRHPRDLARLAELPQVIEALGRK